MRAEIGLIPFVLLLIASAGAHAAPEPEFRLLCPIDKSNSLTLSFRSADGDLQAVELGTEDFLGRNRMRIAMLSKPALQVTHHGSLLMLTQNYGRSGYIFVRLKQRTETEFDGLFDINYFPNRSFSTDGNLVSLQCYAHPVSR